MFAEMQCILHYEHETYQSLSESGFEYFLHAMYQNILILLLDLR